MPGPCPCSLPQHSSAGSGPGKYFAPLSPQTLEHGCLLQAPPPPAPCREGRSFALLLPTPRLASAPRKGCSEGGHGEKKFTKQVFVPTWNESSTCGGAAPGSISLFLCTIARGPEERFPSSCARRCLQPGSGEEFWTQTLFKKKKKNSFRSNFHLLEDFYLA